MTTETRSLYSQLPAIDRLLRDSSFLSLRDTYGHTRVVELLRQMLDEAREVIRDSQTLPAWCENWAQEVDARLTKEAQSALRPVINLTGTVLHTNLGRALQAEAAVEAVTKAMRSPVTLEYDLDDAGRGHRDRALAQLLCRITGAEDACIVNNNAAAVLLMLAATASGKEVVVSRGELVEIGGAFRIPDVMRQAGCTLHEVGTTNRTHANDYRQAVNENTALLMKVHTSNYSIQGFTKAIDEAELVALGKELDVPVVTDLGSGSLVDLSQYGLPKEPMPQELIAAGVSLVSFSGDKLLGGPQAGIIVGKKEMIARLQSHPLKRALRADKMTLAALEATLRLYLHPEALSEKLPTLRLLTRSAEVIQIQAQRLQAPLAAHYGAEFAVQVMPCLSQIGSGSLPVDRLPSAALTFTPHDGRGSHLESLAARWQRKILDTLATYHEQHRDEPGPGRERLRRMALPMEDDALVLLLIEKMRESGDIHSHHGWLHLPDHKAGFSEEQQAIWQKAEPLFGDEPWWVRDLAKETGTDEQAMRLTLRQAAQQGIITAIVKDRYYRNDRIVEFANMIRDLDQECGSTCAADFRDRLGVGRKLAIQILEYFDRIGFTRRRGNDHLLRDALLFPEK
ncbi:L-seryl-tRNA(Sec) selenium transferase [Escherichia coli]|nr:L-seryl-tRNA(Sec) selenium transferase [Escherichia coli]